MGPLATLGLGIVLCIGLRVPTEVGLAFIALWAADTLLIAVSLGRPPKPPKGPEARA
jgi:hypothetical protein